MRYGMTFLIDLYDFENEAEHHVLTTPGDYIRMRAWAKENMPDGGDETVDSLRRNYAITWFALKRRGKLGEFDLPKGLDLVVVDSMADRFSIFVNDVGDDSLPLKKGRGK